MRFIGLFTGVILGSIAASMIINSFKGNRNHSHNQNAYQQPPSNQPFDPIAHSVSNLTPTKNSDKAVWMSYD